MTGFHIGVVDIGPLEPAGLDYCRLNGLSTHYETDNWTIVEDSEKAEELLIVDNTVIWTAAGILNRAFGFEEEGQTVRHALFARFPCTEQQPDPGGLQSSSQLGTNTQAQSRILALNRAFNSTANIVHMDPKLSSASDTERALVIILDELAHIYYLDGRRDLINMPFKVRKAVAATTGVVLERIMDIDEYPKHYRDKADQIPKLFFLPDPLVELGLLAVSPGGSRSFSIDDDLCLFNKSFLVTCDKARGAISIWAVSRKRETKVSSNSSTIKGNHARRRSSMRTSFVNIQKQDDLEEDRRTSSTRTDLGHLERMVSADIDPALILNEVASFRRDFDLDHLETVSVACHSQAPHVFTIQHSKTTVVLCIYSSPEQTLLELVFRLPRTTRPVLVQSNKVSCTGAIPVSLHGHNFILIRSSASQLILRAPMSPDIVIDAGITFTPFAGYSDSQIAGYDAHGSLKRYTLDSGFTEPSILYALRGLQFIMTEQHYRLFSGALIDAHFRLKGETQIAVFASTILASFLNPAAPMRNLCHATDSTIDYTVIRFVGMADVTCRQNDLTALQSYLPQILLSIHFVSEEMSLDVLSTHHRYAIMPLLAQLANWLQWESYVEYYTNHCRLTTYLAMDDALEYLSFPTPRDKPPSIYRWINNLFNGSHERLQTIELLGSADKVSNNPYGKDRATAESVCPVTLTLARAYQILALPKRSLHDLIEVMVDLPHTLDTLDRLPQSIALPLKEAIAYCSLQPLPQWGVKTLAFIGRQDLVNILSARSLTPHLPIIQGVTEDRMSSADIGPVRVRAEVASTDCDTEDEHHSITRLIFHNDRRIQEVSRLLRCHKTILVQHVNDERLGEAEQIREQEKLAALASRRTMAVPIGRGLLHFNFRAPLPTQKFPLPKLNFDVKLKPAHVTVSEDKEAMTAAVKAWCQFHNGVAAGLSVSIGSKEISASWIVYNKPEELTNGHAGFLLGLGLNGHLAAIATWHAFNYLTSKHTMTSIGLLLGLSASFIGSMEPMITKLLSVHILALLPQGSNELNLSGLTQAAGVIGIGLLHFQTGHRRMSEVMLKEIADSDTSADRFRDEGYRLAAGLALGIINAGNGGIQQGSRSLNFLRLLVECVQGTNRETHDLDMKMPGAIIALGLVYLKTSNKYVAGRLVAPSTKHGLNCFRPDLYLLRTLARGLIMWDEIEADSSYIASQLPPLLRVRANLEMVESHDVDNLILFNIIVGSCLAIGMKYAGTLDLSVRDFVLGFLDRFMIIGSLEVKGVDDESNVVACRTFLGTLAYVVSMIMAGSGDIEVLRRLRRLHFQLHPGSHYGYYIAIEMSIGLLFLSGGQFSLSRTNLAICSYVAAFYPILPTSSTDNRSHLQALRHLWVLGAEPRCIVPRVTGTNEACLVPIRVIFRDVKVPPLDQTAPCLLPPLETIASITTTGEGYWPVTLEFADVPDHLKAFRKDQTLFVKRKQSTASPLALVMNNEESASSSVSGIIASMIGKHLRDNVSYSEKLMANALSSPDARSSQMLIARMSLTACLKDPDNKAKMDEVRLILTFWEATQRGILKEKYAECPRLLDAEFIQKLQLDLWRIGSDSGQQR